MDVSKGIRMAVDTGDVRFGSRDAVKDAFTGKTKLIVLSNNCPKPIKSEIENKAKASGVHVLEYSGTSIELGSLCGKPFPVSSLSVIEPGNSNILDSVKKE